MALRADSRTAAFSFLSDGFAMVGGSVKKVWVLESDAAELKACLPFRPL